MDADPARNGSFERNHAQTMDALSHGSRRLRSGLLLRPPVACALLLETDASQPGHHGRNVQGQTRLSGTLPPFLKREEVLRGGAPARLPGDVRQRPVLEARATRPHDQVHFEACGPQLGLLNQASRRRRKSDLLAVRQNPRSRKHCLLRPRRLRRGQGQPCQTAETCQPSDTGRPRRSQFLPRC